jgi:hypothetical protein
MPAAEQGRQHQIDHLVLSDEPLRDRGARLGQPGAQRLDLGHERGVCGSGHAGSPFSPARDIRAKSPADHKCQKARRRK